ncbi:MAG: tRNA(Ser) Um(44) 2'-O-methyltransferase [Trichoglossum hirsutum]|nr:MAG: tRNA(Ser) Um(44) 2'-O-methyltransferase [Trichoglossum hirsutum]
MSSSFAPVAVELSALESATTQEGEPWWPVLEQQCDFQSTIFCSVMMNLIKNPNINSNRLFRADILYDSLGELGKPDYDASTPPRGVEVAGFSCNRTLVRLLIPRNPQLDRALVQTCHILQSSSHDVEKVLVVYLPHADNAEEVPFYHPTVNGIAFLHTWGFAKAAAGKISIHYKLFRESETDSTQNGIDPSLKRVAFHLLSTVHKHGKGVNAGYKKRVHHDRIIPQQRLQDTYSRLKMNHAKRLIEKWVEQTDPTKHVFEDLGIAAFLIELWKDMYTGKVECSTESGGKNELQSPGSNAMIPKREFPGFVDIGCGNGILVEILRREGYSGWGFDARRRKTWDTFTEDVQASLKQMVLVPKILAGQSLPTEDGIANNQSKESLPFQERVDIHDGSFPCGTFIISNHADELTGWTPLIASLSESPFLIIPCCSHDLSGARFRAHSKSDDRGKQPSAYASLIGWVESLASDTGWEVEKEVLRIPSTRNVALIGRTRQSSGIPLLEVLQREGGGFGWMDRALALTKKKPNDH